MGSGAILVTGSAGHLGEALMRTLRASGREARGVDRIASANTDVVGSITDRDLVEQCMDGVEVVLHTATLHKPHIATHSRQDFVDTNISGTLLLLEAAVRAKARVFIYTSTTSAFGDALNGWITEDIAPIPKNIYGVTKAAGEDLCVLAHRNQGLPCLVLRTSRFFPEADDDPGARTAYADANLKANEFLYRRLDVEDVVSAHLCAIDRATALRFGRYIVSATTPFRREDTEALGRDAPLVVSMRVPEWEAVYAKLGWRMAPRIDRVYDNAKARADLGWHPRHDFAAVLARAARTGGDVRSPLAREIGIKGYHGDAHVSTF